VPAAQARPPALARLVGQTIMTGFSGTRPSAALLARIRRFFGTRAFGRHPRRNANERIAALKRRLAR